MSPLRLPRLQRADKLLIAGILGPVLLTWVLLVGFDAFLQFARQLGELGRNGYTLGKAAYFILLTLPRRSFEMYGNAALIGTLLGLGGLAASHELTALRAAGMARLRIGATALLLVGALSALALLVAEYVMPPAEARAQAILLSVQSRNLAAATGSGLWARDGDAIVNVRSALATREVMGVGVDLRDVRIYRFDAQGRLRAVEWAAGAHYRDGRWRLEQVSLTRFGPAGASLTRLPQATWNTTLSPRLLELSVLSPQTQSLRDLLRNIDYLHGNGLDARAYSDALWQRLFYPLNVLLLVLCTLPLAFGTLRSGGFGRRLLTGLLIAVGWFFVERGMVNLAIVYSVPAWLANLGPLLLLAATAGLLFRWRGARRERGKVRARAAA